jgi:hypothetical protein
MSLLSVFNGWGDKVYIETTAVAVILESRRADGTAIVVLKSGDKLEIRQEYVASLAGRILEEQGGAS